jgi:hypothetical protein
MENKQIQTGMMQVLLNIALLKWLRAIGIAEGREVQLGRLGRIMMTAVSHMLGFYVLVPPHPPHAWHTS